MRTVCHTMSPELNEVLVVRPEACSGQGRKDRFRTETRSWQEMVGPLSVGDNIVGRGNGYGPLVHWG